MKKSQMIAKKKQNLPLLTKKTKFTILNEMPHFLLNTWKSEPICPFAN